MPGRRRLRSHRHPLREAGPAAARRGGPALPMMACRYGAFWPSDGASGGRAAKCRMRRPDPRCVCRPASRIVGELSGHEAEPIWQANSAQPITLTPVGRSACLLAGPAIGVHASGRKMISLLPNRLQRSAPQSAGARLYTQIRRSGPDPIGLLWCIPLSPTRKARPLREGGRRNLEPGSSQTSISELMPDATVNAATIDRG